MKNSITEKPKHDKHLFKWFARNLEATIYKANDKSWITNQHKISTDQLWNLYASKKGVVGVRPGKETNYAMVDLDIGSMYHPKNSILGYWLILASAEKVGVTRTVTITSSWSGGLHIYMAFPEEFNSFNVALTLKHQFELDGIIVAPGQVEIFPNQKAYSKDVKNQTKYNGHRLPLQEGSFILDDDLNPYSDSIDVFCALMEQCATYQDMELFKAHFEASKELKLFDYKYKHSFDPGNKAKSDKAIAWENALDEVISKGWTGKSQTNKILLYLHQKALVFTPFSGEMAVQWMVETAKSMPGFDQWCNHKRDLIVRCRDWITCSEKNKYYKKYRGTPDRLTENCNSPRINKNDLNASEAQKRILDSIQDLGNCIFRTTTEFLTAVGNKCKQLFNRTVSLRTLYKYKSLWEGLMLVGDSVVKDDIQEVEIEDNSLDCGTPCLSEVQGITNHCIYEGILSQSELPTLTQSIHEDHNHPIILASQEKLKFEIGQKPLILKGLQDFNVDSPFLDRTAFSCDVTEVLCFDAEDRCELGVLAEEINQEFPSDIGFHRGREGLVSPFM